MGSWDIYKWCETISSEESLVLIVSGISKPGLMSLLLLYNIDIFRNINRGAVQTGLPRPVTTVGSLQWLEAVSARINPNGSKTT